MGSNQRRSETHKLCSLKTLKSAKRPGPNTNHSDWPRPFLYFFTDRLMVPYTQELLTYYRFIL